MRVPPASLKYLQYSVPTSRSFMLNLLLGPRPCENAFPLKWRMLPKLCSYRLVQSSSIYLSKKTRWRIRSSMNGGTLSSPPENGSNGPSRLIRVVKELQDRLSAKVQEIKTEFPMKLLFFLVGFYCATGFATVIGQTGDWDVLCAGLAVLVVEGIGALMYNSSFPLLRKIKNLISMFNLWKAGLTLGLFLDAFKYEMDGILGLPISPFNFDFDMFHIFF